MQYLEKYRQVLVTTYRDFVLVGYDADGEAEHPRELLAGRHRDRLLGACHHPRKAAPRQRRAPRRVPQARLLRQAPIAAPQDLAWFLASYARDARARIEDGDLPALAAPARLEEALGMKFEGEKGEHFFRSTLVQTLFYGVFSAWVLWAEHHAPTDRQARFAGAAAYLHIPVLRKLFYEFAAPPSSAL